MTNPVKKSASGFEMPSLGFGTWRMGGAMERDLANDDGKDIAAIRYALQAGINHIDTAEIYANGYSETLVGEAIKGLPRQSYTIASKVKLTNLAYETTKTACRDSLKRLGLDYVDLYYMHRPSDTVPLTETAKALRELRAEGLIRYYGICNFNKEAQMHLQDLLDAPIAVNQSHYSLVFREPEVSGLLEHCRSIGTVFTAWRPLQWHNATRPNQPAASAWEQGVYPILDGTSALLDMTNVQTALSWLISQPNVTALVKSATPKHIDELVKTDTAMPSKVIEQLRRDFPEQRQVSDTVPLMGAI